MESEDYQSPPTTAETGNSDLNNDLALSKTETVKLLQQSIQQLEQIVARLNVEEESELPAPSSISILVTTTKALAKTVKQPPTPPQPIQSSIVDGEGKIDRKESSVERQSVSQPEPKVTQPPVTASQPSNVKTIPVTKKVIVKRRRQLIVPVVVALIIAIALGTWLWLSRPLPQFLARIFEPEGSNIVEPESENPNSEVSQEITTPTSEPVPESSDSIAETAETETSTEIDIPTELVAPGKSKTVAVKPIQVKIELTPEQNLIAVIKDKVAALSQQYPEEVVSSVEANFRDSSLLVTISDLWYQLDVDAQNRLTKDIFKRAQDLDFKKLTMQDPARNLIARNPVVGNDMVIFRRQVSDRDED